MGLKAFARIFGAGSGSTTSTSIVTANGFAGTVTNPASTPAITLSTTITGILQGNGTAISAVTPGAAVADATGAGDVVAQLNTLLSRLRVIGLINT